MTWNYGRGSRLTLLARLEALEAHDLPHDDGPPYVLCRVVDASVDGACAGQRDDVRIGEHVVRRQEGETMDQLCMRAVSLHGPQGGGVPILVDEPGPANPIL